jgi:hypothetical protein
VVHESDKKAVGAVDLVDEPCVCRSPLRPIRKKAVVVVVGDLGGFLTCLQTEVDVYIV